MTFPNTTFITQVTHITQPWAQAVNDWLWKEGYVENYWDGTGDASAAVQTALTNLSVVKFRSGVTYTLASNITIPANRKIVVEKGAILDCTTGMRWTAYLDTGMTNVEWQIDGWIKSSGMAANPAPRLPGWPGLGFGEVGDCRGFMEFGGNSDNGTVAGFWVHGTGRITGDWVGGPDIGGPPDGQKFQVNQRGIYAFGASKVRVEGIEIANFYGEQICFNSFVGPSYDWVIDKVYSHDGAFNALNFNAIGVTIGARITNCHTLNCYAGIEMSVGTAEGNFIDSPAAIGIWTGAGGGTGPICIKGNILKNVNAAGAFGGSGAIAATFSSAIGNLVVVPMLQICNNYIINPWSYGIYVHMITDFIVSDNFAIGVGQGLGGYMVTLSSEDDAHTFTGTCKRGVVEGNVEVLPGTFGAYAITPTSPVGYDVGCLDIVVQNNYRITTTSAAPIDKDLDGIQLVWTPVMAGLTVVAGTGGATYTGQYTRIGNIIYWELFIIVTGTCTTASTINVTSFSGLPVAAASVASCCASEVTLSGTRASLPSGMVQASTVFCPTWAASNSIVTLSGWYFV